MTSAMAPFVSRKIKSISWIFCFLTGVNSDRLALQKQLTSERRFNYVRL